MKLIPESEVPVIKRGRKEFWRDILESIPLGKALVISKNIRHPSTVKNMLRRYKSKKLFENYYVTDSGDKIYVVNHNEEV